MAEPSPHLVHLFPSFGFGDVQLRTARMINLLGAGFRHTVVALDRCFEARALIDGDLDVGVIGPPPGRQRSLELRRLMELLEPDLLLACGASAAFVCAPGLLRREAALVLQVEGPDLRSNRTLAGPLLRRILRPQAIVTSSPRIKAALEAGTAERTARVELLPLGVASQPRPRGRAIPGLQRAPGEVAIGTVIPPHGRHHLAGLLRAFRAAPHHEVARVILLGDRAERSALRREAEGLGIIDRVLFPDPVDDPTRLIPELDLFALVGGAQPQGLLALEAMAAGLPLIGFGDDDLRQRLSEINREFLVDPRQLPALTAKLDALLRSTQLRRQLGRANRDRAADFPLSAMVDTFEALIDRLLEASDLPKIVPDPN